VASRRCHLRSSFEIVRRAIVGCVPGADDVWFDPDREQIVLSVDGHAQPLDNLSAGQRMMLALVADIAIKFVTQNTYLVPESAPGPENASLPLLLQSTPGVILIDEIDVHLHPRWQRTVVGDLMRTFPAIQFVCTSHSPQVVGMLPRECVVLLNDDGTWAHPMIGTRGTESNEILNYVMGASDQDPEADRLEREIDTAIDAEDYLRAEDLYRQFLEVTEEPTVQRHRLRALIENERMLRDAAR
jgi:predicted ATP-binding protein involved in virulence